MLRNTDMAAADCGGIMSTNWIILLVGLTIGALPSWWVTHTYYGKVIAQGHEAQQALVVKQEAAHTEALLMYADEIVTAKGKRDENSRIVAGLRRELDGLRVHFPTCAGSPAAEGGAGADGGSGIFSAGVDEEFARLQGRVGELVERCDTLNADTIEQNERIKSVAKLCR